MLFQSNCNMQWNTTSLKQINHHLEDRRFQANCSFKCWGCVCRLHFIHHPFLRWNQCHHRICHIVKNTLFHILWKSFLPLVWAFMVHMSLMSSSVAGVNNLLSHCTTALTWDGMFYRAHKSRSILIIRGRSMYSTPFSIKKLSTLTDFSNFIPSINSKLVKYFGRTIDGSVSDRKRYQRWKKNCFQVGNL